MAWRFEVLHPQPGDDAARLASVRPNALSCVLRITAAGPAGRDGLAGGRHRSPAGGRPCWRAAAPGACGPTWLLVPHHGSKTSSSAGFLDAVQPRTALVQAGLPQPLRPSSARGAAALPRFASIAVVESSRCGAATWLEPLSQPVSSDRRCRTRPPGRALAALAAPSMVPRDALHCKRGADAAA